MSIDSTTLFVCLDDFCRLYESSVKAKAFPSLKSRQRQGYLSLSEMLYIEILYHLSPYKNFKYFYVYEILNRRKQEFRRLPCYDRFVALKKQLFMPLVLLLHSLSGDKTGIYFADSTSLKVCRNQRINNHKVFKGIASRAKSTMGWFFGLKLHLVINHKGQVMAVRITPGNIDDRAALKEMIGDLKGKCYADKGYVGKKLFDALWKQGVHLITGIRKNMNNHLMPFIDKTMLRKRFIIETIFGVMKTDLNLEHSRHRSPVKAFVNILACIVAYSDKTNKPQIKAFLINP